ncbi:CBU_0592 family membrane protein [Hyphomonas oceanitis]|uniref:CBU-0592-like domain-containing protein n=1 Tax=Hyphomonas oceanitis SCH89 TaxID=1280953 RepID=A0A059GDC3_9PROT|nr:hypothetical protein [Hyphomonas oceanitis]KDA04473.1 hypothetical protein HOC_01280 [Hyphomonas oceanitis SCH89]
MVSLFDAIGIVGVVLTLLAYLLLQAERIESRSRLYSALNLFGSVAILVSLAFDFNLSAALMEGCWALISLYGLVKAVLSFRRAPPV